MITPVLEGCRIAVILESKFIPEEIAAYQSGFALLGASVDLVSRLYYGNYRPGHDYWKPQVFLGDVDPNDHEPWESPARCPVPDDNDFSNINLDQYDAVIMAANYTSVRLRYADADGAADARAFVQAAPAVRFFAEAMAKPDLVKGALCHGLWILTPNPHLLEGRRVTCHAVVMADILNTGAHIVFEVDDTGKRAPAKVVRDGDLVTGYSKAEVLPFIQAITEEILARKKSPRPAPSAPEPE
ncbi:MAG: DJ-1/PfpI family protein [Cyanobacteria bacterium J06638_7]